MAEKGKIVLIGMPGSGKSTAGLLLARSICYDFLDTDLLIQKREGSTLQKIIEKQGMSGFIKLEEDALLSLPNDAIPTVIATGGSAVLSELAMSHLKSLGLIVWIDVPIDTLKRRLRNIKSRGIAMEQGQTIDDVWRFRKQFYEKYADLRVDTTGRRLEETVELLMKKLGINRCEC